MIIAVTQAHGIQRCKDQKLFHSEKAAANSQQDKMEYNNFLAVMQLKVNLKGSVSQDFLGPFLACMDRYRSV